MNEKFANGELKESDNGHIFIALDGTEHKIPQGSPLKWFYEEIDNKSQSFFRLSQSAQLPINPSLISDTLGVSSHIAARFQREADESGFTGVEFKQDPTSPYFHQAHFSDEAQRDKYAKHRGLVNASGSEGSSAELSPRELQNAERRAREIYG